MAVENPQGESLFIGMAARVEKGSVKLVPIARCSMYFKSCSVSPQLFLSGESVYTERVSDQVKV